MKKKEKNIGRGLIRILTELREVEMTFVFSGVDKFYTHLFLSWFIINRTDDILNILNIDFQPSREKIN